MIYLYTQPWIVYATILVFIDLVLSDTGALQCPPNSPQSELNSFLWTLKRDPPSYFFGTIHVPYTRVWDYVPQSTKNAFRYSDKIYFELDLTDGATAAALANCQLLPDGTTLSDVLSRRLYRRLTRHMEYIKRQITEWTGKEQKNRGIKNDYYSDYQYRAIVGTWQRMKPVWLMLLLNSITESDVKLFGVPVLDLYLSRQAVQWGKGIGAIEDVTEQCEPLNQLNHTQVIFALDQTLRQHEQRSRNSQSMPENDELITHYNCGDLKSVLLKKSTIKVDLTKVEDKEEPDLAAMARQVDEYFQQQLLYNRNEIMVSRIEQLLLDYPKQSFFFAVGAGHFLGNDSVIERLISRGLPIEHTRPESIIQSHSKRDSSQQGEFSRLDSSVMVNEPYLQAIRQLDQAATARSLPIRHERNRDRKKYRKDRYSGSRNRQNTQKDELNFSKLWIRVEEIRQVTESKLFYDMSYEGTESTATPNTSSGLLQSYTLMQLLPATLLWIYFSSSLDTYS